MRLVTAYRLFLLLFIAAGAFVAWNGLRLKYYGVLGPGAGFFPVWIGALLAAACAAALLQSFIEAHGSERLFPDRDGALRVLLVLLSLAALAFALKLVGFRLAMLAFVLLVPRVFGPQSTSLRLIVALLLSFGVGHVFEKWLGVELPAPAFEPLQALSF